MKPCRLQIGADLHRPLERVKGGRSITVGQFAAGQALPSRIMVATMPKAAAIRRLGGIQVVESLPTNRQLVIGLGIQRRVIGQNEDRRKRRGMLSTIIQVHHPEQLLVMQWRRIANQKATERIVGDNPHPTIRIRQRSPQGLDRPVITEQPQGHRRRAPHFCVAAPQNRHQRRRRVKSIDLRGVPRRIDRSEVAAVGRHKSRGSNKGIHHVVIIRLGWENEGADHRANSAASYAATNFGQAGRTTPHPHKFLNRAAPGRAVQAASARFLVAITLWAAVASQAVADSPRPAVDPQLAGRLGAVYRTAIADKPLREAMLGITQTVGANLWLDRSVDPTIPITLSSDSRTFFRTIFEVAEAAGATVVVVDRWILVGHRQRVTALAGVVWSGRDSGLPIEHGEGVIDWPAGTTAAMACQIATGSEAAASLALPHDIWPATRWHGVSRPLATLMVAAQFDRMPLWGGGPNPLDPSRPVIQSWEPLVAPRSIKLDYPVQAGPTASRAASKADSKVIVDRSIDQRFRVAGSPEAHVAAVAAWLLMPPSKSQSSPIDELRFTIRLENIPALRALEELARAGDLELRMTDDVRALMAGRLISLTETDQTVRHLIDLVAQAAGLAATWRGGEVTLSPIGPQTGQGAPPPG